MSDRDAGFVVVGRRILADPRQEHPKHGSPFRSTSDFNIAAVVFNDSVDDV